MGYAERGPRRKLLGIVYDADRPRVCGELVSRTKYYAVVRVAGCRHWVPLERLRSGRPEQAEAIRQWRYTT